MHKRAATGAERTLLCSISLVLVLAAPAPAQPASHVVASPNASPASAPPVGPSPGMTMESFLPVLPPSEVPPRLEAPYPCQFPHSAFYEHPTRPTVVTFTVTAKGRVTNASTAQSSGSGVVDEAVRDCVSAFIYAPAMRDGAPVDVSWAYEHNLTITRGRVPQAPPPGAPQGTRFVMMPGRKDFASCELWHQNAPRRVLVAFDVEPDASVKNATAADSSGDAAIDKDAIDCVNRRVYKPATRDGEPVEIRLSTQLFADSP